MGMQDGNGAGVALKVPIIAGKGVDGVPATADQQIIQRALLLLQGQRPECQSASKFCQFFNKNSIHFFPFKIYILFLNQ